MAKQLQVSLLVRDEEGREYIRTHVGTIIRNDDIIDAFDVAMDLLKDTGISKLVELNT